MFSDMAVDETTKLLYEIHGKMQVLDERTQVILKQAEKTNGRVTFIEAVQDKHGKEIASARGWAIGASGVIGAVWAGLTFYLK